MKINPANNTIPVTSYKKKITQDIINANIEVCIYVKVREGKLSVLKEIKKRKIYKTIKKRKNREKTLYDERVK